MPDHIVRVTERHYGNISVESGYTATIQSGATLAVAAGGAITNLGAPLGGLLTSSTTTAGTPATTVETDLWTYSLPAGTLAANLRGIRITGFGSCAANANSKTIKMYFGATNIASYAAATNGNTWLAGGLVFRTGAATQLAHGAINARGSGMQGDLITTPAETLAGAIVIKIAGTSGVGTLNDIVFNGATVELL